MEGEIDRIVFRCSKCGVELAMVRLGGERVSLYAPHFCPHCGKDVDFRREVSCDT